MKIFLTVLVIIFNLQFWTEADDIREFEIEGITLYESALSHYSISELQEDTVNNYASNKYTTSNIYDGLKMYNYIQISYKTQNQKTTLSTSALLPCCMIKLHCTISVETSSK